MNTSELSEYSIAGFRKISRKNTIAFNFNGSRSDDLSTSHPSYFNSHEDYSSREQSLAVAFARKWTERISSAVTVRYLYSSIGISDTIHSFLEIHPSQTFSYDFSSSYSVPWGDPTNHGNFTVGLSITNIGTPLNYSNFVSREYLPAHIGLGLGWEWRRNEIHSFGLYIDANKLLVPLVEDCQTLLCSHAIQPSALDAARLSFSDAPGGIVEELSEIYISVGGEYGFSDRYFFRTGFYFEHPNKGDRKMISTGLGFRFNQTKWDLSYQRQINTAAPIELIKLSAAYEWKL